MKESIDSALSFLLENAGASIRYRVKKEILRIPTDSDAMKKLQEEILSLPKVQKAFAAQREDGFIGRVIHGGFPDGFDTTVDFLKRNGVELDNPHLVMAKECLLSWRNFEKDHFYKAGNAMDEHGRGGFRAIWADELVELGADESTPRIAEQIDNAISAFRGALNYSSIDDFTKKIRYKGEERRYYIKGAAFPAANHVSILEKTLSWRNDETVAMVKKSYRHCMDLMEKYSGGCIFVNCGYLIGPFNYNWQMNTDGRKISVRDFDDCPISFAWFMKGLSTAQTRYPLFENGNPHLAESLLEWLSDVNFTDSISPEQLRMFKNYASIEPSWRKNESVKCDLVFPLVCELNRRGMIEI